MSEIEVVETNQPLAVVQPTIESILAQAVQAGRTGPELQALLDVYERMQAKKAEREFNQAFAKFKAECPKVRRRFENIQFMVTRNGVRRPSRYAALEDIDADTRQSLVGNGLSCAWGDAVVGDGTIAMACVLYHVGGHNRSSSVTMPHESKAGSSPQQKYASTITYLQRYSLIAALGLTMCDEDTDGEHGGPEDTITEEQAAKLLALITETKSDWDKFLKYANVAALSEIKESRYVGLLAALEGKKGKP